MKQTMTGAAGHHNIQGIRLVRPPGNLMAEVTCRVNRWMPAASSFSAPRDLAGDKFTSCRQQLQLLHLAVLVPSGQLKEKVNAT
ncbi:hypothetical protein GWO53_05700 [Corynebacterium macginleyi]|uniref:Uncharacterized protein n=1 Tax=Corynebacterium macginleyi TaxID=38290 RepID=A0A3M0GJE8_9CORY|nr:hypothetical protein [Corynebacterium macginleyi]MBK4139965.1 hypothetical protein [Corynebacterium macginleyi]MBK4141933.1 hypothetical protein [Corynebacterium macginleyi]MBK4143960.1 hypothetical protein [Corynebacterium macginleyi]MBK4147580.1 hypothetical protein [Corynebacterium macginleyi]MBK4157302.1 hypothetical protein [Corynebacterium macginleyi]